MSSSKSKKRRPAEAGQPSQTPAPAEGGSPPIWVRSVVSAIVVWHVLVVFLAPLSVPPASQLVVDIAQSPAVRWYTDSLYLNHGYHFFGPDPPINQLVRYRVADQAGQVVAEGQFPSTADQWPRLLYHRHMMLADQAALGPPDLSAQEWLELSLKAYARRLLRVHSGDSARVDYVRHQPLAPAAVLAGEDANAAGLFVSGMSAEQRAADLEAPLPVPPPPTPAPPPEEAIPAGEVLPPGGL
ncbi:hypothetical protein [Botrimarina sp.]|uniref:hypothetical protein n=1 Tax=Botrimarina sp. TaxID=2795802 RepID=UPI0032EB4BC4